MLYLEKKRNQLIRFCQIISLKFYKEQTKLIRTNQFNRDSKNNEYSLISSQKILPKLCQCFVKFVKTITPSRILCYCKLYAQNSKKANNTFKP